MKRKWSDENLIHAIQNSFSIRQVLQKLSLVEAGGNYQQVQKRIKELGLDISHFTGKGWNKNLKFQPFSITPLADILRKDSSFQSFKLKNRLFRARLKKPKCEICGWSEKSSDGRIPVELDHINGDRFDNRIQNLRILCPNCHSLQPTHRGKNKYKNKG